MNYCSIRVNGGSTRHRLIDELLNDQNSSSIVLCAIIFQPAVYPLQESPSAAAVRDRLSCHCEYLIVICHSRERFRGKLALDKQVSNSRADLCASVPVLCQNSALLK